MKKLKTYNLAAKEFLFWQSQWSLCGSHSERKIRKFLFKHYHNRVGLSFKRENYPEFDKNLKEAIKRITEI